jgi:hypothetical protein
MPFGATQSGLNMPTPGGRFMPTRDIPDHAKGLPVFRALSLCTVVAAHRTEDWALRASAEAHSHSLSETLCRTHSPASQRFAPLCLLIEHRTHTLQEETRDLACPVQHVDQPGLVRPRLSVGALAPVRDPSTGTSHHYCASRSIFDRRSISFELGWAETNEPTGTSPAGT